MPIQNQIILYITALVLVSLILRFISGMFRILLKILAVLLLGVIIYILFTDYVKGF